MADTNDLFKAIFATPFGDQWRYGAAALGGCGRDDDYLVVIAPIRTPTRMFRRRCDGHNETRRAHEQRVSGGGGCDKSLVSLSSVSCVVESIINYLTNPVTFWIKCKV